MNRQTKTSAGKWVGGWGTCPVDFYISLKDYVKKDLTLFNELRAGTTVRTQLQVTAAGPKIRLRFSNQYGKKPVTLGLVSIARTAPTGECDIISGTAVRVTFDGGYAVKIQPGETVLSDEVGFPVCQMERLSVSVYYNKPTTAETCGLYSGYSLLSTGKTEQVNNEKLHSPIHFSMSSGAMGINFIPFLTDVEVFSASKEARTVVMFGDSTFCNDAWLHLEERILSTGVKNVSVVNKAISGNRLLHKGVGLIGNFYGDAGVERFERDVLSVPGVSDVFVKLGVNDVTHPCIKSMKGLAPYSSPDNLVDGYRLLAERAHEKGIRIYFSDIAPWNGYERNLLGSKGDLTWSEPLYRICCEVNEKLYDCDGIDGVLRTEVLADENDKTRLSRPFTIDCMHFSPLGAIAFADMISMESIGIGKKAECLLEKRYRYFPKEIKETADKSADIGENIGQAFDFIHQMTDHMRMRLL